MSVLILLHEHFMLECDAMFIIWIKNMQIKDG